MVYINEHNAKQRFYSRLMDKENFKVVLSALRYYFINADPALISKFSVLWEDKYGFKKRKSIWDMQTSSISDWTLVRILELLPPLLPENQRTDLILKIVECTDFMQTFSGEIYHVDVYWSNYQEVLESLSHKLSCDYFEVKMNKPKRLEDLPVPDEIYKMTPWLLTDSESKKIAYFAFCDKYLKYVTAKFASALEDVNMFRRNCQKLQRNEFIYEDVYLNIHLITQIITVRLHKKDRLCGFATI